MDNHYSQEENCNSETNIITILGIIYYKKAKSSRVFQQNEKPGKIFVRKDSFCRKSQDNNGSDSQDDLFFIGYSSKI